MTAAEFKQQHTEQAHLEGNDLYNAMEDAMLKQQAGAGIIRSTGGFFTRYKLRKLFYYPLFRGTMFVQPNESSSRCSACKRGVSFRIIWVDFEGTSEANRCPYCKAPYVPEPNTNLIYRYLKLRKRVQNAIVKFLNWACIVGSNTDGRYGLFGDEVYYVASRTWNMNTCEETLQFRKRKWFEYIFVKQ